MYLSQRWWRSGSLDSVSLKLLSFRLRSSMSSTMAFGQSTSWPVFVVCSASADMLSHQWTLLGDVSSVMQPVFYLTAQCIWELLQSLHGVLYSTPLCASWATRSFGLTSSWRSVRPVWVKSNFDIEAVKCPFVGFWQTLYIGRGDCAIWLLLGYRWHQVGSVSCVQSCLVYLMSGIAIPCWCLVRMLLFINAL